MDCVCAAETYVLDVALDPCKPRYYTLKPAAPGHLIQALDLSQGLVLTEFHVSFTSAPSQMTICDDLLLCSSSPNSISVYSGGGGFKGSFVCGGKMPYVVDRLAVSREFVYFSTSSHNNVYACSYSSVSQLSATRQLLKFKLPKGVLVLSMQQKPGSPPLLVASCSDGLVASTQIRVWTVLTQEEEIGILDPAKDIGLNKKVIKKLIHCENYPAINAIDFTSDGGRMLAAGQNGAVNIWRTERLPTT